MPRLNRPLLRLPSGKPDKDKVCRHGGPSLMMESSSFSLCSFNSLGSTTLTVDGKLFTETGWALSSSSGRLSPKYGMLSQLPKSPSSTLSWVCLGNISTLPSFRRAHQDLRVETTLDAGSKSDKIRIRCAPPDLDRNTLSGM